MDDQVCKYFLDAVEKSQYGWFWECPNGPNCHYRYGRHRWCRKRAGVDGAERLRCRWHL